MQQIFDYFLCFTTYLCVFVNFCHRVDGGGGQFFRFVRGIGRVGDYRTSSTPVLVCVSFPPRLTC